MDALTPDPPAIVEDAETPARAPKSEVRIEGLAGYGGSGMTIGAMPSLRYGALLVAPSITYSSKIFSDEMFAWRMGTGASFTPSSMTRLELLGVGGVHVYRGVGAELLGSAGANGTRPFLGAWAGASMVLGHFTIGAWAFYEGDLERSSVLTNDPVKQTDLFGGTQHPVQVGTDSVGVMLRLGVAFGG